MSPPRKPPKSPAASPAPPPPESQALERAKKASTGQLLFRCARLLNERALARARALEVAGPPIRAAHTSLFPHIDLAGTRLTELARRVGISKQAVAQLVDELQDMGVVERVPDPADGRAKLIRFTSDGGLVLFRGLELLRSLEAELREEIGARHMDRLHAALLALEPVLERDDPDAP